MIATKSNNVTTDAKIMMIFFMGIEVFYLTKVKVIMPNFVDLFNNSFMCDIMIKIAPKLIEGVHFTAIF